MSHRRYLFLVSSSLVAVAVLWGIWRHLGTRVCCDALGYGEFGASIRDVGLWGGLSRFQLPHLRFSPVPLALWWRAKLRNSLGDNIRLSFRLEHSSIPSRCVVLHYLGNKDQSSLFLPTGD